MRFLNYKPGYPKLVLLLAIMPSIVVSQIWYDFEIDGLSDWQQLPVDRWSLDSLSPINGKKSLFHTYDNSVSSTDHISTYTGDLRFPQNVEWNFSLRYEGNPSSSNNWMVWLLSEKGASGFFDGDNSGLMLGVNQTSSNDSIAVYGMLSAQIFEIGYTQLATGNLPSGSVLHFRIELNTDMELSIAYGINTPPDKSAGTFRVPGLDKLMPSFFGISFRYTSSRDRSFWFDDFSVSAEFLRDSLSPQLISLGFPNHNSVSLHFNESIKAGADFAIHSESLPAIDSLVFRTSSLEIRFREGLANGNQYGFNLKGLQDYAGNGLDFHKNFLFQIPGRHEILISEIMADPVPAVYLPECEYIEIYNTLDDSLHTAGWELQSGNHRVSFPATVIYPDSFLIITQTDCAEDYPSALSLLGTASFLSNTGSLILLSNQSGEILDAVEYDTDYFEDPVKKEGGWSLEKADLLNPCGGRETWIASQSIDGGTPGKSNSVQDTPGDVLGPYPVAVVVEDSLTYRIRFNEELDTLFSVNGFRASPPLSLEEAVFLPPFYREIRLSFTGNYHPFYFIPNFRLIDCHGNPASFTDTLILAYPERPEFMDVLINEVMFDPFAGKPEYIELYNRSEKMLSLDQLNLQVNSKGAKGKKIPLTTEVLLIPPKEYLVLAKNHFLLESAYPDPRFRWIAEPDQLPALPDTEGLIRLLDRGGVLLDEVSYRENDHFSFLGNSEGVSLERIFINDEPGIFSEWNSASWDSGGGTPGFVNSQYSLLPEKDSEFTTEHRVFTPNNDGIKDVAVFRYSLGEGFFTASFMIFNARGERMYSKTGIHPGSSGSLVWNGKDRDGKLCPSGIYLGYLECLDTAKGRVNRYRQAVTLAR